MTSVAAKRRAHKAARKLTPVPPKRSKPSLTVVEGKPREIVRQAGLDWLLAKKRITRAQHAAGQRWGLDYRLCMVDGLEPLRSCLNDQPRGGQGRLHTSFAAREAEARDRRAKAVEAIAGQAEMVEALDLVCGRQLTPWEHIRALGGKQREVEEMQTTIRLALDILSKHYRLTN